MAKHRKAKKSAKKTHRKLSSWQKFMKAHSGKGYGIKKIARMYREAGHGKKKTAKRGKRRHRSGDTSMRLGGFRSKFRKEMVDQLVERGLSLASAKKKVSEYLAREVSDDVIADYARKFNAENAESLAKEEARVARRKREKTIKDAIKGIEEADRDAAKAEKKAAKERRKAERIGEFQKAFKEAESVFSGAYASTSV